MARPATRKEEDALKGALAAGRALLCPRCGRELRRTSITPRTDVSYVRRRILLDCDPCAFRAVLDKK